MNENITEEHEDPSVIDVQPTKSLFVDMLTRDIGLGRAVLDLVDNSIDGARRLRPEKDADFDGLQIDIELDANQFRIQDNCGGIPIDLARKYAFRIGRPPGMTATPNSVGQFGVGMKRALFKFGRIFEVNSKTANEAFDLRVNVDQWVTDDKSWKFKFDSTEAGLDNAPDNCGTTITVTGLREDVATTFGQDYFRIQLTREIQSAEQEYIDRGLRITVNQKTLIATPWQLAVGSGMQPANDQFEISAPGQEPVHVRIFAGTAESSPQQAGWYVFCNGRMVLEGDQSSATGWSSLGPTDVPKYHNQFARFRGFVFFDCKDARRLPWNTTKTGVDTDSAIFQSVRLRMIDAMRPVITFLNDLDAERENPEDEQPLTTAVSKAALMPLKALTSTSAFKRPDKAIPKGPPLVGITFKRPQDRVDALQQALGVTSRKQTGEMAFDMTAKRLLGDES